MKRGLLIVAGLGSVAGAAGIPPAPAGITNLYDLAEYAGQLNRLPPNLMRALVNTESAGDTRALSNKGAMGLAQLMPGTAREMGVTDPWNPWQNLYGGAKYLRQQLDTFGRTDLALAAYNSGAGNVRSYGGIPPFAETQQYVQKITALYALYSGGVPSPLPPVYSPLLKPLPASPPVLASPLPPAAVPSSLPFVPPATPPFVPPPLPAAVAAALAGRTPTVVSTPKTTAKAKPVTAPISPVKASSLQIDKAITPESQSSAFTLQSGGLSVSAPSGGFQLISTPLGGDGK